MTAIPQHVTSTSIMKATSFCLADGATANDDRLSARGDEAG